MQDPVSRATRVWTETVSGPVLVMVRHGRTTWNATRRFVGKTDVPLDAIGERQALALAERLPGRFTAGYTSPLRRAQDTARPVHDPTIVVDALAELDQGALEGLDGRVAMARFPDFFAAFARDPGSARIPGGERLGDLRDRAVAAIHEIASAHAPGERVGIFSHQMVIASLTCTALGRPLTAWRSHRVGNAAITALVVESGKVRVLDADIRLVEDIEADDA